MLMTVAELRRFIETEEDDQVLEAKLQALESLIRAYTNNNFQIRAYRSVAVAVAADNALIVKHPAPFAVGDTLQVSESDLQNMMKWELNNRDKVGVASETISRHSVTYFSMDGDNSMMGYPRSLLGFLRPYKRARFGGGIGT